MNEFRNIFIAIVFAVLSASCSLADVNQTDGRKSDISISVDWSEVGANHPDSLYIIASHTADSMTFGYLYPEMLPLHEDVSDEGPMVWPSARYALLSFNKRDDMEVTDRKSLRRICLSLPVLTEDEVQELIDTTIKDYNPHIGYIPDAGTVCAETQIVSVYEEQTDIVIKPKPMTADLTVRFFLDVHDEVEITGVDAILSGLVGSVYPLTGYVDYDNLYKSVLPVEPVDTVDGVRTYEAKMKVLGIFPPETETATIGKGILQLAVSTVSYRGEKIFNMGINLMHTINGASPMVMDETSQGYRLNTEEIVLDITNVLEIHIDTVVNDENDGVDEWFMNGKIDIQI